MDVWIDNGERGNHGMGLGVFVWSGICHCHWARWKMEEVSSSYLFLPYHILLFVARLLFVDDVGPSVAGCIEILIDRARHFFQISAIESVLLINRNSMHISNLVAVVANNSCHQARPRSPSFRLRHLTIIKQQQRRCLFARVETYPASQDCWTGYETACWWEEIVLAWDGILWQCCTKSVDR